MKDLENVSHFKQFGVNSYETGHDQNLKINCLFQWFSEIAWEHAKKLNFGFEDLDETDKYWVLLGMNVEIKKLPKWQDQIKLQTWPSGISGLYYNREFVLFDEQNEIMTSASSSWLIYDRKSLRPSIPSDVNYLSKTSPHKATIADFAKLKPNRNIKPYMNIKAKYTDIDMHNHVNNAVYIRWIEDVLGDLKSQRIQFIKIQYIKEVKLGDEIEIFTTNEDNKFYFEAIINNDKPCFRAEIDVI